MLVNDCSCATCGASMELVIHVLCDCSPSRNLWLRVVPHSAFSSFFGVDLQSWITQNIQKQQPLQSPCYVSGTACDKSNTVSTTPRMDVLEHGWCSGDTRLARLNWWCYPLWIQSDCSKVVKLVGESGSIDNHIPLLRAILKLRQSGCWVTKIQWISRNGNKIADRMAKLASRQHYNLVHFDSPRMS
ncbi:hypothetical protein F3Y22_tig00002880pilonHSYRG00001 [Hibiscus syriacus]|uniref:RNase H type-1 domain-containing protein n=1 Tax=Hibiscus syriacus TaxID=106335 RepID=A0A6A3CMQ3_HIBSY|nr:hypothetical protein F3Y22_tig00002880pilonHSYRG00001 [Hibiscus syriacus]